jgi:phage I-like protein
MANLIGAYALSEHAPEGGSTRSRGVALLTPTNGVVNNGNGDFEVRSEDLELYAESLRNHPIDASFDYDHSFLDRGDTRAAGWIDKTSVRVEGDKILADVDWTPSAAKAIREGEYKYVSPEFVALKRDDAGVITQQPKLIAAGLTNRPFLKTLGQVALSDKTLRDLAAEQNPFRVIDDKAAERLAAYFSVDKQDVIALAGGRTPDPKPSQEDDMSTLKDTAKALGLSEDATEQDVITAVQALKATAEKAPSTDTIQALTKAAESGVQALAELHTLRKQTCMDTAITERRMLSVERESMEALYDIDRDKVEALLAARPKGSFSEKGSGGHGADDEDPETVTALSDGSELEFDASPEAITKAARQALKDDGITDPSAEQLRDATREAYRKLAQR